MSDTYGKAILVPIHVDALVVVTEGGLKVAGPTLDFSKTPWDELDERIPYLGETIVREPFSITGKNQSDTLGEITLQEGTHLHWSLPDAFTRNMSLPIIRLETFRGTFGFGYPVVDPGKSTATLVSDGDSVWHALKNMGWITPLAQMPSLAKVLPKAERKKYKEELPEIVKSHRNTIERLLDQSAFPAVPNCWWINIYPDADLAAENTQPLKQIVSDMLVSLENQTPNTPLYHTALPVSNKLFKEGLTVVDGTSKKGEAIKKVQLTANQPYRFLGQAFDFGDWTPSTDEENNIEYLEDPLTALGGGDPTFAAFYPNCRSVFGYHDQIEDVDDSITYEVIGGYREEAQDYFRYFIQDFQKNNPSENGLALLYAIKESFGWWLPIDLQKDAFTAAVWQAITNKVGLQQQQVADTVWQSLQEKEWIELNAGNTQQAVLCPGAVNKELSNHLGPALAYAQDAIEQVLSTCVTDYLGPVDKLRLLCYGTVKINFDQPEQFREPVPSINGVAIGNSGTEALSAYLADQLSTQNKNQVEDYLEALQFFAVQNNRQLDIGAKFLEHRHTKGFTAESAGTLWTIRAINSTNSKADSSQQNQEATLPDELAEHLNALNILQVQVDQQAASMDDTRAQLFADWCKYLKLTYYGDNTTPADPNVVLSHYIEDIWKKQLNSLEPALVQNQLDLAQMLKELSGSLLNLQLITLEDVKDWTAFFQELLRFKDNDLLVDITVQLEQGYFNRELTISVLNGFLGMSVMYQYIFPQGLPPKAQELLRKDVTQWSASDRKGFSQWAKGIIPQEAIAILTNAGNIWDTSVQLRYNRLILQTICPSLNKQPWYVLQAKAAPRFWTPNEPSLLLTGPAAKEPKRFGNDGRLRKDKLLDIYPITLAAPWTVAPEDAEQFQPITQKAQELLKIQPNNIAFNEQSANPWQPFYLEWEVDVFTPDKHGDQHQFGNLPQYSSKYLVDQTDPSKSRYVLKDNQVDLSPTPALQVSTSANSPYRGYSIITPHAGIQLTSKIRTYLIELLEKVNLTDFYQKKSISATDQTAAYVVDHAKDLGLGIWLLEQADFAGLRTLIGAADPISWLENKANIDRLLGWLQKQRKSTTAKLAFDIFLSLAAHEKTQSVNCLSQSLSGFNAAMLTLVQMYQLPVVDLLEEDIDFIPFSNEMRKLVSGQNRLSPQSLNPFLPVRAGRMNISKLNILDNFGRRSALSYSVGQPEQAPIVVSEPLASDGKAHCTLPPRFVPPMRLNFRWLSASHNQLEMNDHPATSPICGWVLPNFLDNSLMVYNQSGSALGYIDLAGNWRLFPGHLGPALPEAIGNMYLRRMVRWFCSKAQAAQSYMDELIQELKFALDSIEPESTPQHQALSLLMGRPLALVRASLSMEGKGEPVYSQNWAYVKTYPDNKYAAPTTYNYEQVNIPVRIGERSQLNDGLVLCWEENAGAEDIKPDSYYVNDQYYASQSKVGGSSPLFYLSANREEPVKRQLSMLVDPKGVVHATSGVLPTKAVNIPADQYAQALQRIEVVFYTGPLLTDEDRINIGTPNEPGYHWAWTNKLQQDWRTISRVGYIQKQDLAQHFPSRVAPLWQLLQEFNWIKLSDTQTDAAMVMPSDQRKPFSKEQTLSLKAILPLLEEVLDSTHLNPFLTTAKFSGRQEIREGWLRLQSNPISED